MPKRPLLIFPKYETAEREKKKGFSPSDYHYPTVNRQKERLTPQFESISESFITDSAEGIKPEYVLVIESRGKIVEFERAVRAISGLEWLIEIDAGDTPPDEDFYKKIKIGKTAFKTIEGIDKEESEKIWSYLKKKNFITEKDEITDEYERNKDSIKKKYPAFSEELIEIIDDKKKKENLPRSLYLSISNIQAMNKIESLWKSWDTPDKSFPRGYGEWKNLFSCIKTIRRWDAKDRINETGILDYWEERLQVLGSTGSIRFEIELWYRKEKKNQKTAEARIREIIKEYNGKIITVCKIEDIRFHALKAELSSEVVKDFINEINTEKYTKFLQSEEVMFFRPSGQFSSEILLGDGEIASEHFSEIPSNTPPVAAILDGVPFLRHSSLENRLIFDDPDDFHADYQVDDHRHGTAMASLICHSELDSGESSLTRPVYIRPIMKPNNNDYYRIERIPDDIFFEDIIEYSVRRIFENSVTQTIKIINLSICDPYRMFFYRLSSCAKLLDWLSEKYQVLFCVSAGNITSEIDLGKNLDELKSLEDKRLIQLTTKKIDADIRNRRLLAPADSINSLTVGALHKDESDLKVLGNRIDILPDSSLPSPISAHGNGFRNSIKPEIYMPGGRQLYDYEDDKYKINQSSEPPGQKVAAPPRSQGERGRNVYIRGTSNAAALATRACAQIFEVVDELIKSNNNSIPDENIAVIIKTLLVHSASSKNGSEILEDCLKTQNNSRQFRNILSRYIGYGVPDINRVLECTKQRATVIGSGVIEKDDKHEFTFPLPYGLEGRKELIKIIITLAWFSPINPDTRKFRKANLSFDLKNITERLKIKRQELDGRQVKNGTVQHEIIAGKTILDFGDSDNISIDVVCREDAGSLDTAVRYGLAVTFEVSDKIDISIYDQIKEKIEIPVKIDY